jgi:anti-anti-sigma factor
MLAVDPKPTLAPWFSVELAPARDEVRLLAIGELDLAAATKLYEPVSELLAAGFRQMVLDLRQVTFIDVAGVRSLLKLACDARNDGWRLSLVHVGGQVRQTLALTGVLDQLPIRASLALVHA